MYNASACRDDHCESRNSDKSLASLSLSPHSGPHSAVGSHPEVSQAAAAARPAAQRNALSAAAAGEAAAASASSAGSVGVETLEWGAVAASPSERGEGGRDGRWPAPQASPFRKLSLAAAGTASASGDSDSWMRPLGTDQAATAAAARPVVSLESGSAPLEEGCANVPAGSAPSVFSGPSLSTWMPGKAGQRRGGSLELPKK